MLTFVIVALVLWALLGGYFYAPRAGYTTPTYATPSIVAILVVFALAWLLLGHRVL